MTREEKLDIHLEMIIFADLPEGMRLNNREMDVLKKVATVEQKRRAYEQALVHSPLLVGDERTP